MRIWRFNGAAVLFDSTGRPSSALPPPHPPHSLDEEVHSCSIFLSDGATWCERMELQLHRLRLLFIGRLLQVVPGFDLQLWINLIDTFNHLLKLGGFSLCNIITLFRERDCASSGQCWENLN